MTTDIIVSYDGTSNDDDALALGRMLAKTGASLALAYVRHSREFDPRREELAQHDAERRLAQGAAWLGDPELPQHIVVNASTWEGLAALAASEGASVIVFGSDYRTPPGNVVPGTTAQHLLEGGPVAIAVAPAGTADRWPTRDHLDLARLGRGRPGGAGDRVGARREARRDASGPMSDRRPS